MKAVMTYFQFKCIVLPENNPQILYTVDKDDRPEHVHIRAWGSIVTTLLEPPSEEEFRNLYSYARKVESLEP